MLLWALCSSLPTCSGWVSFSSLWAAVHAGIVACGVSQSWQLCHDAALRHLLPCATCCGYYLLSGAWRLSPPHFSTGGWQKHHVGTTWSDKAILFTAIYTSYLSASVSGGVPSVTRQDSWIGARHLAIASGHHVGSHQIYPRLVSKYPGKMRVCKTLSEMLV